MEKLNIAIIIPTYNEEKSIYTVIKKIPLISEINQKVIIINDGSTDRTFFEAKKTGVKIVSNKVNLGLGYSFKVGIIEALKENADIIVNLDADDQYDPRQIPRLIAPLLSNKVDLVVGNRFINESSYDEKTIRKLGNKIVSIFISKILLKFDEIYDTQSSFRAFNKKIGNLLVKKLSNKYNYAQEMIILAKLYKYKIRQIAVKCNKRSWGKSRLIKNVFIHLCKIHWISLISYIRNRNAIKCNI